MDAKQIKDLLNDVGDLKKKVTNLESNSPPETQKVLNSKLKKDIKDLTERVKDLETCKTPFKNL